MPFGLRNAAQTFQRVIDEVTHELPFGFALLDDSLIDSSHHRQNKQHQRALFQRLFYYGIVIYPEKRQFGVWQVDFLDLHIDSKGMRPLREKVEAFTNFPLPTPKCALQRFLSFINYYRRFAPKWAALLHLLEQLLSIQPSGKAPLPWSPESSMSLERVKKELATATLINNPTPDAPM